MLELCNLNGRLVVAPDKSKSFLEKISKFIFHTRDLLQSSSSQMGYLKQVCSAPLMGSLFSV